MHVIILYGALRSGTTVFRLMLGSHPALVNPGETDFLFDYVDDMGKLDCERLKLDRNFIRHALTCPDSGDAAELAHAAVREWSHRSSDRRIVLVIHRHIDRANAIFPGAKVIHLLRDPRDVARSSIGMGWAGNTYYGVDHWLATERNWDTASKKLSSSQVLEVRYESLIDKPAEQLANVCRFLGLPFSEAMLQYNQHSTYDAPDRSVIEQWRRKLSSKDVALVEVKAGDLMLSRNYALSGYEVKPLSQTDRIALALSNKLFKWRFACRRYGTFNVLMEKLTRRLSPPLHGVFVRRINEISIKYLK